MHRRGHSSLYRPVFGFCTAAHSEVLPEGAGAPGADGASMSDVSSSGDSRHRRPALSVVIPVGGSPTRPTALEGAAPTAHIPSAEGIERSICSVINQSLQELEVIIVARVPGAGDNNASSDHAVSAAVSVAQRLSEQDCRIRVMAEADIATGVETAEAPLLTVLDPHDTVAAGAYEIMTSQLSNSGSQAVIGAMCPSRSLNPSRLRRRRARLVDVLDALEDPLMGRLLARTELWRAAVCPDEPVIEAIVIKVLMAARMIDVIDYCVLQRSSCRDTQDTDDGALEDGIARAQAIVRTAASTPALLSRLLGAWMRDEVVDLAIRAVEALPYESGRRLRDDVGGLLPAVSDKAWSLLPLLDRALVWVLAYGTRTDLEELIGSRIEDTTACPIQLVEDPRAPLHAIPPVLDRIAALPAELLTVHASDLRLIATGSPQWRTPYCLEVRGLAYVRGLSCDDSGSLFIEAFDDDGALVAKGRASRKRALNADVEADDPWHSHISEGYTAALWMAGERADGKRVRLRAVLTIADRTTAAWLPDLPEVPDGPAEGHGAGGGVHEAGSARPVEVTLDAACIEDGILTLEGRASQTLDPMIIRAHSQRGDYELTAHRVRTDGWRVVADLYDTAFASGEHVLTWNSGSEHSGPCLAGVFISATPVELAGHIRSVRLCAGADRQVALTVMPPLTAFERSSFGRAQLVSRAPGSLKRSLVFESFDGRSTGEPLAAILADLLAHGLDAPVWWTVADGATNAPQGSTPVVRGSRAWFEALRTARIIIADDHLPEWFYKRPGQRIIRIWRSMPNNERVPDAPSRTARLSYRRLMARQVPQWDLLLPQTDAAARDLRASTGYTGRTLVVEQPRSDGLNVGLLVGDECKRQVRAWILDVLAGES